MTRVAAVQSAPVSFDLAASVRKLQALVAEAKAGGAELVLLPEAFLSAYPRYMPEFGIGYRKPENREWYARYVKSAVKVPEDAVGRDWLAAHGVQSPGSDFWAFAELAQTAKQHGIYLSVGIIERSVLGSGSTVWCTNLIFSPYGVLLAKHRKIKPTGAERMIWSEGEDVNPVTPHGDAAAEAKAADNLAVVETGIGRMGAVICWENYMPLLRYVLYKKGVELYLAPTADGRDTWLPTMQHIALEGRCFVISANQFQQNTDFPADYPPNVAAGANANANAKPEVWSRGGTCIVGPLGEVLAGPLWDREGIVYADIDIGEIHGAKLDFDPVGHYSRETLLKGVLAKL